MRVGTLEKVVKEMEGGVYNYCKDGKCANCGACCSALLPLSAEEITKIKRYVRKNGIKRNEHFLPTNEKMLDMVCPFLNSEQKCDIYEVRPHICRVFKCDQPPSTIKENKEQFWRNRQAYYMPLIFGGDNE